MPGGPVPAGHERALRAINIGVWLVAVVVMVVSATTAAQLLTDHGMHWLQGLALGLAVDAGIVVALVGDRMLHRVGGCRSRWGTALRWVTASMSLLLNCAGAWQAGDKLGVVLHALPPLLLMVLAEAAQAYRMALTRTMTFAGSSAVAPVSGTEQPHRPEYPGTGPVGTAVTGTRVGGTERMGTASATPAGTGRAPTPSTAPVDSSASPAGTGLALVRPRGPKHAAATPSAEEIDFVDPQLWQRAVELAEQHHRDTGRDIRLDDVQGGLGIGRNRAAVLRRAVLAHLEQRREASA